MFNVPNKGRKAKPEPASTRPRRRSLRRYSPAALPVAPDDATPETSPEPPATSPLETSADDEATGGVWITWARMDDGSTGGVWTSKALMTVSFVVWTMNFGELSVIIGGGDWVTVQCS